jgi:hypothetical protein
LLSIQQKGIQSDAFMGKLAIATLGGGRGGGRGGAGGVLGLVMTQPSLEVSEWLLTKEETWLLVDSTDHL